MSAQREPFDWNSWLWWISLTALTTISAMFLVIFAVFNLGVPLIGTFVEGESAPIALQVAIAPLFALAGALVGGGQWLILRSLFSRAGWWVLATAAGWMAGYLWSYVIFPPGTDTSSFLIVLLPWVLNGLATGLCQWLIVRQHYDRSGLWIPTAALAMAIGTTGWLIGGTFGGAFLWLAAGAFSGWVLLRGLPPKRYWPEQRRNRGAGEGNDKDRS